MRMSCPHCGHQFQVRDDAAGKRGRCPNEACRQVVQVPILGTAQVGASPTPRAAAPAKKSVSKPAARPAAVAKAPQYKAVKPVAVAPKKAAKKKSKKSSNGDVPLTSIIVVSGIVFVAVAGFLISRSFSSSNSLANAAIASSPTEEVQRARPASYTQDLEPFIKKYCGDCHSNGSQEGDFAFDRYASLAAIREDRTVWAKVLKLVKVGAMPPHDSEQPSQEERDTAIAWLDHQLFFVDCNTDQNPGRVTVKRLNKTEYNNTVQDLLGVKFRPADDFPSDDVGHGFDNIGDVLTVPPLLMEKYLSAAEDIANKAIPKGSPSYAKLLIPADNLKGDNKAVYDSGDGKAIVSTGRVFYQFDVPRQGKYKLRVTARQDRAGKDDALMEIKFGGKVLNTLAVKRTDGMDTFTLDFDAAAGSQEASVAFTNDFYDEKAKKEKDRNLHIGSVELEGPFGITDEERKKLVLTRVSPEKDKTPEQAARENLKDFLPRAFRRPVTDAELGRYAKLVDMSVKHGESFEEAMGVALQAILISPHFLYRIEGGRRIEGQVEMLDDYALASRLSYFLWSTLPDDELFEVARQGKLHEREELHKQTARLLKDPRSNALVANFAGQWLGLRKLVTNEVDPDAKLFPGFNKELRLDFWKETESFFGSVIRSNSSIYDLLDGRYTFLNERLAKFYGIEGVTGPEFRRVDFKDEPRAGVLTQASILTLTSFPNRTSPVKRGEWVLTNLLGDSPPEAPPLVPALDDTSKSNPNLTFRQQLELHRKDPGCASCHKEMDAIGFGMQTFDAIGRFRSKEGEHPVDASGVLPSGDTFNGPLELIALLRKQKTKFGRCLTEKMMTYSLGRGVEWYDRCAIDKIMSDLEKDDRMETLIYGVIDSGPFHSRRFRDPPIPANQKSVASNN